MRKFLIVISFLLISSLVSTEKPSASTLQLACQYHPLVADLLAESDATQWLDWIEKLSGAEPAQISGINTIIQTRETRLMFSAQSNARAYDFVLNQVSNWYPQTSIHEHEYDIYDLTARNLIVTIPGVNHPDEFVLLTAHLDSQALGTDLAPGANDNGTGAATLLEAARLLRRYQFDRSIQLVWSVVKKMVLPVASHLPGIFQTLISSG